MSPEQFVTVGVFVAVFGLAMWRKTNMGAIALAATFLVGTLLFHQKPKALLEGWPTSLMLTLIGVTFLFGIARENGMVDKIVNGAVAAVRGRLFWVPWVFFFLAAFITAAGAVTPATNAILIPIGLSLAYEYRMSPLLIGVSILNGTNAGGFSPIAVYYTIVSGTLHKSGLDLDAGLVFLATFLFNALLNVLAMAVFGGFKLRGQRAEAEATDSSSEAPVSHRMTLQQGVTLATLGALVVAVLFFGIDIGFAAIIAAVGLALLWPKAGAAGVKHIAWMVVLLIGGVITYVSLMESVGIITASSDAIAQLSIPIVVALLLLFIAGLTSAFASTIAMFGILIPLAAPLMANGSLPLLGFSIALCISASAVDSSPLSTGGALVVANSEEPDQQRVFNRLMAWGLAMVVVAPLVTWLVFVVL